MKKASNPLLTLQHAKRRAILYGVLSLAVMGFIFSQSILSKESSGGLSARVAAFLHPLLDPNGWISGESFHFLVRKAAHFTEFAILGLCLGGFSRNLGILRIRRYIALPMMLALGVAVGDEFLQYFTGRGSMVNDVVLDYAGAMTGLAVSWLFGCLCSRRFEK